MDTGAPSFQEHALQVLGSLRGLLGKLDKAGRDVEPRLAALPTADARASALNLAQYLALRREDLRPLQQELTELGLSSLGRAESDVLRAVMVVCEMLERALGIKPTHVCRRTRTAPVLRQRSEELFGTSQVPCVMVTMPSEAATDATLVRRLLEGGMQVMRINAAHDDEAAWRAMITHLRQAERSTGKRCKVLIDLPGPKLRTLPLRPGARVFKLKPTRDEYGRVVTPGSVLLRAAPPDPSLAEPPEGVLWMPASLMSRLGPGVELSVRDARKRKRTLRVAERVGADMRCSATRTIYFDLTSTLRVETRNGALSVTPLGIRATEGVIKLRRGDILELDASDTPGHGPMRRDDGSAVAGRVSCGLPALIKALRPGQRILFDDGKIETLVKQSEHNVATLEVVRTPGLSTKLRAEKGINAPDSELRCSALSSEDRRILALADELSDMVGLSFARSPDDVTQLYEALEARSSQLGVVLKIETQRGFEELPGMLLVALVRPRIAVMIARGDLAVECGFGRLAELQEEILWLCEAAHVPVIWATQVLESLAKEGHATRAEVTDAAMAERAECVMLNKGPYVVEAVRALQDITGRMRDHHDKKRSMLRALRSPRLSLPK